MIHETIRLKAILPLRGSDPLGQGHYGAPRGKRIHMGVDFHAPPGALILSPVRGWVTKLGYPYGDDHTYRYVEVASGDGYLHRFFYVKPHVKAEDFVEEGAPLGAVQDVSKRYNIPKGMKPHVHYEIKIAKNGVKINPAEYYGDTNSN